MSQAFSGLFLGTADTGLLLFLLAPQNLQLPDIPLGIGRQTALLRAPGFQGLQAQYLALMLAEQTSTLPGLFLPGLLKGVLGLLDMCKQGLLGPLRFTQGALGAVCPMAAQAPQRFDFT
ncbi:hypothetical protein BLL37_26310 [Pseudomonas azotoformans]|uniref:Uncharacterized protein n=1 Tax=Pseudomonas azotoformans TaxID=47878 RepID=A0A1V2J8C6_PSEAZ|nr:hypothetical protein BFL39_13240 [Pseudomonas azotoformans]ONH41668.1 hypothetical protein BLL37_26310 [Pseudomonas azotoformans]